MAIKKIIYSNFVNDERNYFIDYLREKHNWEPILFTGHKDQSQSFKESYPNALLFDEMALRKGQFDYSEIGTEVPIDHEIIDNLSKYSSNFFNWVEDTSGWNFSFSERRRHYYDLLKFWVTVIKNLKPDIFIAYTWPHVTSDYALYLLCKYHFSIPVLYIDIIPYLEGNNRVIGISMEDPSLVFNDTYLSSGESVISQPVKDYLSRQRSAKAMSPKYVTTYLQDLDKSAKQKWKKRITLLRMILTLSAFKKSGMAFKKNKMPLDSVKSEMSNIEYYWFKYKLARKVRMLKKLYIKYESLPNPKDKYIYFAASHQPEVNSNLTAGAYEDTFLVVDMITAAIPDDWFLYYKEHPNVFKEDDKGGLERSKEYYDKLKSYSKVKIISPEINTFNLIDDSQAVCSVGGTVGWEAVIRNKPSLVMGSIWYQSCKSIFKIHSYKDVLDAIKKIKEGYLPDEKDVNRFAQAIYSVSEQGLIFPDKRNNDIKECEDPRYEMERVAKAFYKSHKIHYKNT